MKYALVTGSTRGIGAAIAMELSLVSMLSARDERTQGTFAPTSIPACLTPGTSLEFDL